MGQRVLGEGVDDRAAVGHRAERIGAEPTGAPCRATATTSSMESGRLPDGDLCMPQ